MREHKLPRSSTVEETDSAGDNVYEVKINGRTDSSGDDSDHVVTVTHHGHRRERKAKCSVQRLRACKRLVLRTMYTRVPAAGPSGRMG